MILLLRKDWSQEMPGTAICKAITILIITLTIFTLQFNVASASSLMLYSNAQASSHVIRNSFNEKSSEKNSQKEAAALEDYSKLGLTQLDRAQFQKYISAKRITEKEFYELNFNMQISYAAITDDNYLILRTKTEQYFFIKMSPDYIEPMKFSGIVEKTTEIQAIAQTQAQVEASSQSKSQTSTHKTKSSATGFSTFLLIIFFFSFCSFLFWISANTRKTCVTDKITTSTKEKRKQENPEQIRKVTFDEVQGINELKPDLLRLVDSLKNPEKYKKLGARPTKGLVLYGPPGTGKTLIAKAISGEAGVPFFSASGSDFIEKYVGIGASRVRELFGKARKAAPCIVFIDEIDAIGVSRGESSNTENNQTINALLTELDGFSSTEGILTICATNRLDILDPAIIRPGRFDLKIAVNLPDKAARYEILKLYASNKQLSEEIKLDELSQKTSGFSGAELENILNEAALIAAVKNEEKISPDDIEDAFFKLIMNGHKKERTEKDEFAKLVAYHEAGHTIAAILLAGDRVSTVTIVQSTSGAGGVTFRVPEDKPLKSKRYLKNLVMVMYAGRAAEQLLLGNDEDITTGASQDIRQATEVIKQYIALYGMGSCGMIDMTQLTNQVNLIEEASEIARTLYNETLIFLEQKKTILDQLALELLDNETLYHEDINRIVLNA